MSLQSLKTPESVVLYSRPLCGWCLEAKAWLDARGWKYVTHDTGADAVACERAIRISGTTYVPVIEVDGLVLGDFDTQQLEAFLRQHGYLA
ncbi:MAG: glutaredoxin family protein [Verrucomicrobiae bacterium]|nr:glutaredoxin family protein [Verrucomicrobiae bacterium]